MTCKIRTDLPQDGLLGMERHLLPAISRLYSQDALIVTDADANVLYWSRSATRIFGYSAEEMVGNPLSIVIPVELQAEEEKAVNGVVPGALKRYETQRVCRDGRRIAILASLSLLGGLAGEPAGVLRSEREIPAGPDASLAASHLAAIVESSNDAIVSNDLDGIVTSWNKAAHRLFGYTAEEMIGRSILPIVPQDLHAEEKEVLRKVRAGKRIDHFETRRIGKGGEVVEVAMTISPIRDRSGKVVGSSKIARDISERKETERRLIESEKLAATARMAANIAHEINNPLDSVMNLIYLARLNLTANSKARPCLLAAEGELERVSHLARQALGYYRDPGAAVEIQLGTLLEEVLRIHRSKLLAANIAVDCAFDHRQHIQASEDELMQIFSALVVNAIDAMPAGGVLTIETRELAEQGVEIVVSDRGTGISPEHLPRVFEPFFTTKGRLGTGIGLWVAHQLVEKRGGRIAIDSRTETPSSGTTVSVFLPFQR